MRRGGLWRSSVGVTARGSTDGYGVLPVLVAIGGVRRGEGRDIRGAAGVPPVRVAPMRVAMPGRGARGSQAFSAVRVAIGRDTG